METTNNTTTENNSNSTQQGTNTVKLNVGGRYFEVSLSLIKQEPHDDETMLSRLVSKEWNNNTNNDNPTQVIFIDRDGDIFAHVLNYLRYGSIELPNNIPISMFERELDFYGITIHDESSIQQSTSVGTMQHIKKEIANAELHHDMLLIATSCHTKYMSGRTTTHIRSSDIDLKHNPYFYDKTEMMEVLNDYLGKFYGLQASACKRLFESDLDFVFKVKELRGVTSQVSSSSATSIRPPTRHGRHNIEDDDDGSITSTVSDLIGEALQMTPPRVKRDRRRPVLSETEFLRALEQALMTP